MNIQIKKTYKEAVRNLRTHKMEWARVACAPVILWVLGFLLLAIVYGAGGYSIEIEKLITGETAIETQKSAWFIFAGTVYQIAYGVAMISLYINGYRYAVLKDRKDKWFTMNFKMRWIKMLLYMILIGILSGLYLTIVGAIIVGFHFASQSIALDVILGIIAAVIAIYLLLRIALYPTIISIDRSGPLSNSWRLMKGNLLRLLGLFILVAVTILVVGIIGSIILGIITAIFALISSTLNIISVILWLLFALFMTLLTWAFTTKVMGLVYLELSVDKEQTPAKGK